jgi:hypothetical protein
MEKPTPKRRGGRKPKTTTTEDVPRVESKTKKGKLNIVRLTKEETDNDPPRNVQPLGNDTSARITIPSADTGPKEDRCRLQRRIPSDNRPGYFPLLTEFVDVYPRQTNIACWWCCHSFSTRPVGIPMRYEVDLDAFRVVGCFCSLNCAYAHSRKERMGITSAEFQFMYEKITGSVCEHEWSLRPAPEKFILDTFGGPMTIEEYRASFHNSYEIMLTPLMPFGMLCDEILGRSHTKGWTKNGIQRPLEIRKAKKEEIRTESVAVGRREFKESMPTSMSSRSKQRTTVTQIITLGNDSHA